MDISMIDVRQADFNRGAASRQAEVDELQEKYRIKSKFLDDADAMIKYQDSVIDEPKLQADTEREQATEFYVDFQYMRAERDALQKRIDEALSWLSAIDTPNEAYQSIDSLMKILKGESK